MSSYQFVNTLAQCYAEQQNAASAAASAGQTTNQQSMDYYNMNYPNSYSPNLGNNSNPYNQYSLMMSGQAAAAMASMATVTLVTPVTLMATSMATARCTTIFMASSAVAVAMALFASVRVSKDGKHEDVRDCANDCGDAHNLPIDGHRILEAVVGLHAQEASHEPDDGNTDQGTQHICLLVAKSALLRRPHQHEPESEDTNNEAADITEHVHGIGDDGE